MTILETIAKYRWHFVGVGIVAVIAYIVYYIFSGQMQVLKEPFLGGVFNTAFFGIPLYCILMPIAVILMVIIEGGMWWFYWKPFEYMHGVYRAHWDKINACFIGDLANRYELTAENKAKLIHTHEEYEALYDDFFRNSDPITKMSVELGRRTGRNYDMMVAKKLEAGIHEAPTVQAGGIPIDIIIDAIGVSYSPDKSPARAECIRVTDMWNEMHPEDEIYTYQKFFTKYDEIDREVPINKSVLPKTIKIPMARVSAALPTEGTDTMCAGYERQLATDLESQESADLNKYTVYIIGFFILINFMMWVARAMHLIGHVK